ncbi:hypothetical protein BOTBODRAFT_112506 [Botryobasidium botryosum FD-172 SS1]|uniref:Rrn7/TAF1B C-terminal cyclin domain-containing protein n=1 Tax=Botryobasidium botryosum (strain FD-172 SS1) TaxID=930990 RepID=A0A067MAG2_BOTB1|nr:hypothetical protein BOTBODRAFT_112506 [Botryobasidium botryosum FD-172 SS1]
MQCPTCGLTKLRKDSSGNLMCKEGHIFQGYRVEDHEATDLGQHTLKKRAESKKKEKKEKVSQADPKLYHGERARFHYFQCAQLILRKQVVALTCAWKLPPEFEALCRDIWSLHLALLSKPPPPEPYFYAREQRGEHDSPKSTQSLEGNETRGNDGHDTDTDIQGEAGDTAEANLHSFMSEILGENPAALSDAKKNLDKLAREIESSAGSEDAEGEDDGEEREERQWQGKRWQRNDFERPAANIAVLVLACWMMRLPVVYMDFTPENNRLIESHVVPYLDPLRLLPMNLTQYLTKYTIVALSPSHPPTTAVLHTLSSRLAKLLMTKYNIRVPEINAAPILWRAVRALCGTPALYALAKTLAKNPLSLPLTLHPYWLSPSLLQGRAKDKYRPSRHKSDNIPPELAFVACVITVLKMVYGLDGRESRLPTDPNDPACTLPTEEAYTATLREHQKLSLGSDEELFSTRSKMTALDMDDLQIDKYLAFCERALLQREGPTTAEVISSTASTTLTAAPSTTGAQPAIRHRKQHYQPSPSDPSLNGALTPATAHPVYTSHDILGTIPASYALVLDVAARWAGVGREDVAVVVERFERRIGAWGRRERRERQKRDGKKMSREGSPGENEGEDDDEEESEGEDLDLDLDLDGLNEGPSVGREREGGPGREARGGEGDEMSGIEEDWI